MKLHAREGANHTHPRSHGTADLYHSAPLIVNYVLTVLNRTPQLPSNAHVPPGYMDVPWLQNGFVTTKKNVPL